MSSAIAGSDTSYGYSYRTMPSVSTLRAHSPAATPQALRVPRSMPEKPIALISDSNVNFEAMLSQLPRQDIDVLTSDVCRKALRHLITGRFDNMNESEVVVFDGIGTREYAALSHIVDETGIVTRKPRLSYDARKHIVIVEWPSDIHEVPFDCLREDIAAAVHQIPHNRDHFVLIPQMGRRLNSAKFKGIPDMVLSLTRPESARVYIPFIGECGFSQPQDLLERKLRNEIQAHPEVIMVLMVVIKEAGIYRGPALGSTAWDHFCDDKSLQSIDNFLADFQDPEQALSQPLVVGGHTWCHINSIEYYVWVKKGDELIDISERDPEHTAHGTLLPELSMDAVKHIVNNGFQKIKDYIADLCGTMDPSTDVLQTEAIPITLDLITWFICLRAAAKSTAYERYQTWFESNFTPRGSPFLPAVHFRDSPPASDHEPPAESSTAPQTRSKRRRVSSSTEPTTPGAASESPHSPGRGQLRRSARLRT